MDREGTGALLVQQHGVVSRRQLHGLGYRPHDIERLTRQRELTRIHPGVYVDHTGPLNWRQRAWAGVLALWPAALCHESALREEPDHADGPIHVAVSHGRKVASPAGIRVHHLRGLNDRVHWNRSPPRVRYEEAVVDVAARAHSDFAAFGVLAEACRTRRTTPQRLATTVAARGWLPRRPWLSAVLVDLAAGTNSVLEHGYLTRVERPHGLPCAERQVRGTASTGVVYRDAEYPVGVIVELDGRLVHNTVAQRDADFQRDLDAALDGRTTARLSWGQVFGRPCRTAITLAALLHRHGWTGTVRPCSPGCPVPG